MAYVKQLKDADTGDAIFPVTHTSAVTDGNGSDVGQLINAKQNTLVSGTNIKSVNGNSLLGQGDLELTSRDIDYRETSGRTNAYITTRTSITQNLEALDTAILGNVITYRRMQVSADAVVTLYANNVYQLCNDSSAGTWRPLTSLEITLNYADCGTMSFTTAAPHKSSFPVFRVLFKTDSRISDRFLNIPQTCRFKDDTQPRIQTDAFYDVTIENNIVDVRFVLI